MVVEQNNDYNNYSHHLSQWGLVLFLLVKRKKVVCLLIFHFVFIWTRAYCKFCCVVIPDVFEGLNLAAPPGSLCLTMSPCQLLNSQSGWEPLRTLIMQPLFPDLPTYRGRKGPWGTCVQNMDPLDDPTACPGSTLASSTFRQPLCFLEDFQSKKRCWVAGKGTLVYLEFHPINKYWTGFWLKYYALGVWVF